MERTVSICKTNQISNSKKIIHVSIIYKENNGNQSETQKQSMYEHNHIQQDQQIALDTHTNQSNDTHKCTKK